MVYLPFQARGARQIAHIAKARPNKFSRTNLTLVQSVVRPQAGADDPTLMIGRQKKRIFASYFLNHT